MQVRAIGAEDWADALFLLARAPFRDPQTFNAALRAVGPEAGRSVLGLMASARVPRLHA